MPNTTCPNPSHQRPVVQRRKGAMLVLVAFILLILMVMMVFSVDVAFMQLTRTELRSATDAAARAGSEALSRTQSESIARLAAQSIARQNSVASDPLDLDDSDVTFGSVDVDSGQATIIPGPPNGSGFRGVQVNGRRTNRAPSGSVTLLLGRILGTPYFEPTCQATAVNLDRDICLVVDRSGSMNSTVFNDSIPAGSDPCVRPHPTLSRWAALNTAYATLIAELNGTTSNEQLALVSYSSAGIACARSFTDSDIDAPLSSDYSGVIASMTRLTNNPIQGRTNITAGVANGIAALTDPSRSRPFARRTLIVLTDGLHNVGPGPLSMAPQAVANQIQIHTITFSASADRRGMQDLATAGNGLHFHAPDTAALQSAFRTIARTLPVVMTE